MHIAGKGWHEGHTYWTFLPHKSSPPTLIMREQKWAVPGKGELAPISHPGRIEEWVDGKNFFIWFLGLQYCCLTYLLLAYYLFWSMWKTLTKFLEARFSFKNTVDATMALLCKNGVAKYATKCFCIGIVEPLSIHILRTWVCVAYFSSSQIFYNLWSLHFQFISNGNKSMQIVL